MREFITLYSFTVQEQSVINAEQADTIKHLSQEVESLKGLCKTQNINNAGIFIYLFTFIIIIFLKGRGALR